MTIEIFLLLITVVFGSIENENAENDTKSGQETGNVNTENTVVVKIEENEYAKRHKTSKYIGVTYSKSCVKWQAQRWSKNDSKTIYNGCYDNEKRAAHASDTLARKLIAKGEQDLKLNFQDHDIEVNKKGFTSEYLGVMYNEKSSRWRAYRWVRNEQNVYCGCYDSEKTAAYASDTLARQLMEKGEQNLKLNFPDDDTKVQPKKQQNSSKYFGVTYSKKTKKWCAQRQNKNESTMVYGGSFANEETAAHASDTLARHLMEKGEQNLKLNFPDDETEIYKDPNKKRKRKDDFQER